MSHWSPSAMNDLVYWYLLIFNKSCISYLYYCIKHHKFCGLKQDSDSVKAEDWALPGWILCLRSSFTRLQSRWQSGLQSPGFYFKFTDYCKFFEVVWLKPFASEDPLLFPTTWPSSQYSSFLFQDQGVSTAASSITTTIRDHLSVV